MEKSVKTRPGERGGLRHGGEVKSALGGSCRNKIRGNKKRAESFEGRSVSL